MGLSFITSASPQYPQLLQVLNSFKGDGIPGRPSANFNHAQVRLKGFGTAENLQRLFRPDPSLEEQQRAFIFEKKFDFPPVQREEIKGIDNILEILSDPIELLRDYQKLKPPARLPPGLLFVGPPGTGKSFVERYIATVTEVRSVNVRDFPRKKGPWTSADIKELFQLARAYVKETGQPIILFWDEIDSVAVHRGRLPPDQKEALLELLHQMDGNMGRSEGVFPIGSTNVLVSDLDPALIRPGRFGKPILFDRPDLGGRVELLKSSVAQYFPEEGIDYDGLANLLPPETAAADIPILVQTAYNREDNRSRLADEKPRLTYESLKHVLTSFLIGQKADITQSKDEIFQTAVHEVGHAIVAWKLGMPVQLVTVIPTNVKGDVVAQSVSMDHKDKKTVNYFLNLLARKFGGQIAMEIFGLEPDNGVGSDLDSASQIATYLVEELGWGKVLKGFSLKGIIVHRNKIGGYVNSSLLSEKMRWKAEEKIGGLCEEQRRIAEKILKKFGKERIEWLARRLVERQIILQKELDELIAEAERRY